MNKFFHLNKFLDYLKRKMFIGRGCRIVAMSALDMFPHTHHFETIAVLEGA